MCALPLLSCTLRRIHTLLRKEAAQKIWAFPSALIVSGLPLLEDARGGTHLEAARTYYRIHGSPPLSPAKEGLVLVASVEGDLLVASPSASRRRGGWIRRKGDKGGGGGGGMRVKEKGSPSRASFLASSASTTSSSPSCSFFILLKRTEER